MKIPRDVGGEELAKLLMRYGYKITRQTGSHLRMTDEQGHHVTIPKHGSLKVGTLNNILNDIACHLQMDKQMLVRELFY